MSGICGAVAFGQEPPELLEIAPMLDQMRCRGPDRRGIWGRGRAALGHALLATTPESREEGLPLHHALSGCVITADARIDNRSELLAALRLDSVSQAGTSRDLRSYSLRK